MRRSSVIWQTLTSSMTEQMCLTHWVMACGVPEIVTALSVDSGNMSPATWTWAPVVLTLPYSEKKNKTKKQRLFSAKNPTLITQIEMLFQAPKLSQSHFDMQRTAASQIEMCAPIVWEVHTNIVHSGYICPLCWSF